MSHLHLIKFAKIYRMQLLWQEFHPKLNRMGFLNNLYCKGCEMLLLYYWEDWYLYLS